MKIQILLVFILIVFTDCSRHSREKTLSTTDEESFEYLTNHFFSNIQASVFPLDSIKIENKEKRAVFKIVTLKTGNDFFDDIVKDSLVSMNNEFVNEISKEFLANIDSMAKEGSNRAKEPSYFYAKPVQVWTNNNLVSCSFIIKKYLVESSHPVDSYCSFNFDRIKLKLIAFNDYFVIKSKTDSVFLINELKNAIDESKEVTLNKIYGFDFAIIKDTIKFNFGDYEIGPYVNGTIQASILKNDLMKIINKSYR